jgi:hypothetical protein
MRRNERKLSAASAGCLLGCLLAASEGCGTDRSGAASAAAAGTGTLQVALTASTPEGTIYRVNNAHLDVFNFSGGCAMNPCASVDGTDATVSIDLPASQFPFDYSIQLEFGWTVARVEADGSETPVSATLLNNFVSFTVKPGRATPVVFQFQVGDQVATTGTGSVSVSPAFVETLIDDFEDGDDQLAALGGRNGRWITFNDGSGAETPAPGALVLPQVLDTSANSVLHVTGTGFGPAGVPLPSGIFSFGAGVGAYLVVDPDTGLGKPYNASAFTGIGFTFVTKQPPNARLIVSFVVQTSATTPIEQGGTCAFDCFDGFGFTGPVPYDPNGFRFSGVLPWQFLTQQGFGAPAVFDPTTIMFIQFVVSFGDVGQPLSANAFDLQVDDIAFAPGGFAVPSTDAGAPGPTPDGVDGGPPGPEDDAGAPPPPRNAPPQGAAAIGAQPTSPWSR